jgi:MFS family permease
VLLSSMVSVFGDGITSVALVFAVLDSTNSASDAGLVLSSRIVPQIILLLAGGTIADKHRRHRVMALAQLACFIFQGTLAALLIAGDAKIWMIMILYAALGCAQATFSPASSGLIPQIVDRKQLPAANGLLSMARSTGQIIGPAIGGLIVAVSRPGIAIGIDAATFLVSAVLLLRIRDVNAEASSRGQGFVRDLVEGWSLVRSRQWLWEMIGFFSVFQFAVLGGFYVLGPTVAHTRLGGSSAWGVMLAVSGIGSLIGGALVLRWRPRRLLVGANVSVLGSVPVLVLLSLGAPVYTCIAAMLLYGCSLAYGDALWESALQANVPSSMLSRVASYDYFGSFALRPLGLALAGPLALLIGINHELLGIGAIVVAGSALLLSAPSVRQVSIPEVGAIDAIPAMEGN